MAPRRCCCGGCPEFCMPNGGSLCAIESTRRYVAQAQEGTAYLGTGDPDDICCSALFEWMHGSGGEWENASFGLVNNDDNTDCLWLTGEIDGCGEAELEITSGPDATLTVTLGADTLVWTADSGYDPLCISSFTYSPDDSDPPDDCSWPEKFCVVPSESCCPDYGYPDTLYATVTVTRPGGACSAWTSGTAVIELTRVVPNDPGYYASAHTAVRWEGSGELWPSGSVLDIVLSCVKDGSDPYRLYMDFPISGCAPDSQYADETGSGGFSSCNPFIFNWTDVQNIGNCCLGGFEFDIVVTE